MKLSCGSWSDTAPGTPNLRKKENKESYKGLSIDEMKRFILTRPDKERETFEKVLEMASGKQGKYAIVKKWFLDNYKEKYNNELNNLKIA